MSQTPYYDEDGITIYHGDCEELLPSLSANAVLSDPPYGVGVRYGANYDDARPDYWDWFRGVVKLMRDAAPVVGFTHKVRSLLELEGWDWVATWVKPYSAGSRLGNSPILPHWEPIILYGIHTLGTKRAFSSDVFTYSPQRSGNIRKAFSNRESWALNDGEHHPVPKPVDLYRDLIQAFTLPDEVVLDPFMGSGTTLRAAKDTGRRAIGIEIEERYCQLAVDRLAQGVLQFEGGSV